MALEVLSCYRCSAGAVAAVATSPVDVIKTRMMNQSVHSASIGSGNAPVVYRSVVHCALEIARTEGLHGFYKGVLGKRMLHDVIGIMFSAQMLSNSWVVWIIF